MCGCEGGGWLQVENRLGRGGAGSTRRLHRAFSSTRRACTRSGMACGPSPSAPSAVKSGPKWHSGWVWVWGTFGSQRHLALALVVDRRRPMGGVGGRLGAPRLALALRRGLLKEATHHGLGLGMGGVCVRVLVSCGRGVVRRGRRRAVVARQRRVRAGLGHPVRKQAALGSRRAVVRCVGVDCFVCVGLPLLDDLTGQPRPTPPRTAGYAARAAAAARQGLRSLPDA